MQTAQFNTSKNELDFARSYRASIASALIACLLLLIAAGSVARSDAPVAETQAAASATSYDNGPTGYFPDLFEQVGAIEPQPEPF